MFNIFHAVSAQFTLIQISQRKGGLFTLYEKILNEKQHLEREISRISDTLSTFPEGKILCCRNGDYYKWMYSQGIPGQPPVYIPKSNQPLAERLTLKKYLSYKLEEDIDEQRALNFYLRHHKTSTPKSEQMLTEHPEYQKLLSPYFKPLSQSLNDWANAPYERSTYKPKHLIHKASSGNLVRSKSEVLIDMFLFTNHIPFRYECLLNLNGHFCYPDFTILHPRTGQIYYWEHFGRMDDPKYYCKVAPTLNTYISNGIIPSLNLITTYETKEHPLDPNVVEEIVKHYFL